MIDVAKVYYFIFGALTIVGGLIGFIKKHSYPSLIAGGLCGVLLLIAGVLLKNKPTPGLVLGIVISLALAGQFVPKFMAKHTWMPAGMMSILSVGGIVITLLALVKK